MLRGLESISCAGGIEHHFKLTIDIWDNWDVASGLFGMIWLPIKLPVYEMYTKMTWDSISIIAYLAEAPRN